MTSKSCSKLKVIPAAELLQSEAATAAPAMVTTMVFGSGCSTRIDPPQVWASLVRFGVASARRERRTIW
jgi:hypothetical protein